MNGPDSHTKRQQLFDAIEASDVTTVRLVLARGLAQSTLNEALRLSCMRRSTEINRELLAAGAGIFSEPVSEQPPTHELQALLLAVADGDGDLVRELLRSGASPDARMDSSFGELPDLEERYEPGKTALMLAGEFGSWRSLAFS